MARLARLFVAGLAQHVTQRALEGELLFVDAADYQWFTRTLDTLVRRRACQIHGYALLPDRFHLVLTAPHAGALGSLVQAIGRCYVQYVNQRRQRSGALWQGRYRSAPIASEAWLLDVLQYVDTLPLARGLVTDAAHWIHCSYRHHAGVSPQPFLKDPLVFWGLGNTPFERQANYRARCEQALTSTTTRAIESATRGGWLLGSAAAPDGTAALANRRARPAARGRPRKIPSN